MPQTMTIALAGNPNSGKTTLFNALTGSRQQVGNYPGITVDKREGEALFGSTRLHIVDLPGTYSLSAYSPEELVARNVLVEEKPRVVIDVLDATNLERNLYLAVQFMELGIPVVLALNMMDEVKKRGLTINTSQLSRLLNVPVVETVAKTGRGKEALMEVAQDTAKQSEDRPWTPLRMSYGADLDPVLEAMTTIIDQSGFLLQRYPSKWVALKYMEEDEEIRRIGVKENPEISGKLEKMVQDVSRHCQQTLNTHPEAIIADYRYGFISSVLKQDVIIRPDNYGRITFSDQADRILTHKLLGPLIMVGVLYAMFKLTFNLGETPLGWVQLFFSWLGDAAGSILPQGLLQSLVVSGVIDGVGGVLSFVPLILIMFFCLSFLEDSGYLARMAYMLDRALRVFGLHGCSVMPFIVSGGIPGGCAVPGLMATRTLRGPKEKLATMLTLPYMSCGAKIPVFLLIGGVFFQESAAEVLFWITLLGWGMALVVAKFLRITVLRGEPTPFVMELPPYRLPTLKGLCIHTWERGWQYIRKAGTIILAISILLWAAMTFPGLDSDTAQRFDTRISALEAQLAGAQPEPGVQELKQRLQTVQAHKKQAALRATLAGRLGTAIENVTDWAGFDWRLNIALIGGVAAKEVIVSTLGTAYSLGGVDADDGARSLSQRLAKDPSWSRVKGLSVMVFVLLYAPCFVSLVTMARESSWRWAAFSLIFNTLFAFGLAVAIYQVGIRVM